VDRRRRFSVRQPVGGRVWRPTDGPGEGLLPSARRLGGLEIITCSLRLPTNRKCDGTHGEKRLDQMGACKKRDELDTHHAVRLSQQSDDIIHPAHLSCRNLSAQAKVFQTCSAGNQPNALSLEYPKAQERGRAVTDQPDALGIEADGMRFDGLTLERVQEPIEHLQAKLLVRRSDVAQTFSSYQQNELRHKPPSPMPSNLAEAVVEGKWRVGGAPRQTGAKVDLDFVSLDIAARGCQNSQSQSPVAPG